MRDRTDHEWAKLTKRLDAAWLNLDIDDVHVINPFDRLKTDDPEEFYKRLTCLLMNPEYFSFICKHILNIDLLPMQVLILQEMWNRKFPMLVGSRGLGKAIRPDEKIRVKNGWKTIRDIKVGDKVYSSSGDLCNVVYKTELQKDLVMYRISLRDGRTIDCCEDHMWKVWDKNKNRNSKNPIWSELKTKDLIDDYFYVRKDSKSKIPKMCKEYKYALPVNDALLDEEESTLPLHPYIVGVLLGDGTLTQNTIIISSRDKELLDRFQSLLPHGYILKARNDIDYAIIRSDKTVLSFHHICREAKIWGHNAHTKFIPDLYKFGSYDQKLELIKGLMDTDGWADKITIEYYTVSEKLCDDFIDVIRSLGFSCNKKIKASFIGNKQYADCYRVRIYTNKQIFSLDRKLSYLNHKKSKAGESKYEKIFITKIEQIENGEGYCIQVDSPDRTYITKDYIVTHNTFLLSLYCLLRAALIPNRKIVVVGSAFRQSKYLHDYMENIWKNAPILRDMCDSNSGPRRDVDMCKMTIGSSTISALPIGDGQKIRGQRANDIVADEFACVTSSSIIQTDVGLIEIKDYLNGDAYNLLNINKDFETPDRIFKTPLVDVYQIETANGYGFSCSSIHQVMTTNGWKLAKDLTREDNLLLDINEYFPKDCLTSDDFVLDDKMGWLIGILVSEGTVTNRNYIGIKNTDKKLIEKIKYNFSNFDWKESHKDKYLDKRGFKCRESWEIRYSNTAFRDNLHKFGLDYNISIHQEIPSGILRSPRSVIIQFLSGLYEGDGTAFNYTDKNKKRVGICYYSGSKRLVDVLQILLLKFGIISSITIRNKSQLSNNVNYMLSCRGENAYKLYNLLDVIKWADKFDSADFLQKKPQIRKNGKRYTVSTSIGNKNNYIGSYDSEEECVQAFNQFQKKNRPVIRVRSVTKLEKQEHLYDFHMPQTHSFIANGFVQHNSMSREVFENVIAGFAAVSASPVENVKRVAMEEMAKKMGIDPLLLYQTKTILNTNKTNQIIISGTAFYEFNHFAEYWKRWKTIIETKGDLKSISNNVFNGDPIPDSFKWDDYSIIRIPVDLVPKGFMDEGQIARSKATIHNGLYLMEFGAVFTKDSQGFFKRSLIESCVGTETKPVKTQKQEVYFDPILRGGKLEKYVMAIDPASEVDNFSIVILELHPDHRRTVYCWTTTRKDHTERVKKGLTKENNFYSYCARKIRDLMNLFPVMHIAMDAQGGGYSVAEALHDNNQLKVGEIPIWPIIDGEKPQSSDDQQGLHILEMCQFAKYDWYSDANHGLRKDLEDKILLFPRFDPITIGLSIEEDKVNNRLYDTLEDCVMEIEELKNELSLIEVSESVNGRMRWDTPEVKIGVGKKQRMRKDRYSALLMANMAGRNINLEEKQVSYQGYGGFAKVSNASKFEGATFTGPNWFTNQMNNLY